MSKANAKATDTPAQEAATSTASAAADTGAIAVVQPAPAAPEIAPDEFTGHGGMYVQDADGRRRLVDRTAPYHQPVQPTEVPTVKE